MKRMKLRTLCAAAAGAMSLMTGSQALAMAPSTVDFSHGMEGWVGSAGTGSGSYAGIDNALGGSLAFHTISPGDGWSISTSSNANFLGNFTSAKSITFSLDINVAELAIGNHGGWPLTQDLILEFRDTDKPGPQLPYSSVWFRLGYIGGYQPANQHFSVTIADTSSNVLPAGWHGAGDFNYYGDSTLPYAQTFRRILQDVDQVVVSTYVPGYIYGAEQFYDLSVDNISISAVPEPEQAAMLLAGLGLIGWTARRRQRQQD